MFEFVVLGSENEVGEFQFVRDCARRANISCLTITSFEKLKEKFKPLNGHGETIPIVCHNTDNGLKLSADFICTFDQLMSVVNGTDLRIYLYSCYGETWEVPGTVQLGQINHVTDFIELIDPDSLNDTIRRTLDGINLG